MNHVFEKAQVPMRDGIVLVANVFRPVEGSAPTLLIRTPYGVDDTPWAGNGAAIPNLVTMLNAGYAVVWVACRGTAGSEGVFVPGEDEIDDGYDTVDWVAEQDWSTGQIGMYGPSYTGMTQWAVAASKHPALKAVAPMMVSHDWYCGTNYHPGGAYSPAIATGWAVMMSAAAELRAVQQGRGDMERLMQLGQAIATGVAVTEHTPVAEHPLLEGNGWFADRVGHPSKDAYWDELDLGRLVPQMTPPALFIGGWYDFFLPEQLRDFMHYRASAGSAEARDGSRIVIGPWDHFDLGMGAQYPDRDFGMAGDGGMVDITGEHVRHFGRWLGGDDSATTEQARVRIFVMGIDAWRDEPDWPVPGTVPTDLFLEDGTLSAEPASQGREVSYDYDPRNPVRSTGHSRLRAPYLPFDCAADAERADVLSFSTGTLDKPLEVIGHVTATLFVSSDALDTDMTVRLLDVHPDGRAIRLCDGILRMRYRDGFEAPQLMEPGTVYEVTVDVGATANVFLPGHALRVDVSSSNFPRFDRNTNTGGVIAEESIETAVVAHNTLYTGPERPSRIVLPVIHRDV